MIIKKFTAKTEDDALKAARAELGAQAVIMNVKKVKKKGLAGLFSKPSVEVTAAIEEEKTDVTGGFSAKAPAPGKLQQAAGTYPAKSQTEKKISQYKDVLSDEEYEKLHPETKENPEAQRRRSTDKLDNLQILIEQQLKTVMDQDAAAAKQESKNTNKEVMSFIKLIYTTLINNEVDEKYANDLVEEIEKLSKPGVTIDYLLSNIYQKLILK
ncbi:MAG: hypothetical protein J5966_05065, partial [Lachnospiraceae bacterium]|nr:hypothetical protein [Lachnospiraceae bacterium]